MPMNGRLPSSASIIPYWPITRASLRIMGVCNRLKGSWAREQEAWVDRPWMWKMYLFIAVPPMLGGLANADEHPWFAALALLFAVVVLMMALLAHRAHRTPPHNGTRTSSGEDA